MTKMNNTMKSPAVPAFIGIDLAKHSVHVRGVDEAVAVCLDKKATPKSLKRLWSNLPNCVVGMAACGRAHQWAREIGRMGHEARLVAPQFVKPLVMGNQNDRADAAAIAEAIQRPGMRYVGIKSEARQSQQALHRMRLLAVRQRTALVHQVRGWLAEFGLEMPQGRHKVRKALTQILGDGGAGEISLEPLFVEGLTGLYDQLFQMDEWVEQLDQRIERSAAADEQAKLLMTIPGIGPKTATALLCTAPDTGVFKNGREFSAWLGLVPRPHSTGGKDRLLSPSKRGDVYTRTLLIHGARAVVNQIPRKEKLDVRGQWIKGLLDRRHSNVVTAALANRMVRPAWAVLNSGQPYRSHHVPV